MKNTFPKSDHLCDRGRINQLFAHGQKQKHLCLTVQFVKNDEENKVLVRVPKRCIKKATARNRIKRLIREAWRQNKTPILHPCYDLAIIYSETHLPTFAEIDGAVCQIISTLYDN